MIYMISVQVNVLICLLNLICGCIGSTSVFCSFRRSHSRSAFDVSEVTERVMHVIQGGWVGQTYALATSSDAGGKKSRIRRSKEERKTMVESFIKKYQNSNKGDFPSLNLTHKEVGGSFYTVREIVREIIQENRVLAPPKKYMDRHDSPGFLDQQCRPVEHQNNLSELNQLHVGELWSNSSVQLDEPELKVEQVFNGLGKTESNQFHDTIPEASNSSKKIPSSAKDEFENEEIVNGSEGHVEAANSGKALTENDVPLDCNHGKSRLQLEHKVHPDPLEIQEHSYEQYLNNNKLMFDDAKSAVNQVHMDMNGTEIMGKESTGGQDTELSHIATLETSSVVEMEILAMKSDSGRVIDLDGKSFELHDAAERSDGLDNTSEKLAFDKSNFYVVDDANFLVGISTTQYTSKGSAKVGGTESKLQDKNGLKKMDRINLETWKVASKKSESNPVVAFVKAFLSVFLKLWSR